MKKLKFILKKMAVLFIKLLALVVLVFNLVIAGMYYVVAKKDLFNAALTLFASMIEGRDISYESKEVDEL